MNRSVLFLIAFVLPISSAVANQVPVTTTTATITEEFNQPITAADGQTFGTNGAFAFTLYRGGTFQIDGTSGLAWQKSDNYRDSAIIRGTRPLSKTYKVNVVVGDVEYDLANIAGLPQDPEYSEGPQNENGCYFLAITDEPPVGHHTNDWWHLHRKIVIDVDNNVQGDGMPRPIFMVYFDLLNQLVAYNGSIWQSNWDRGVQYEKNTFYQVQIEKTPSQYILSVSTEAGALLKSAAIEHNKVWHGDNNYYQEYFVLGDPHENYYQGSFKIKSMTLQDAPSTLMPQTKPIHNRVNP